MLSYNTSAQFGVISGQGITTQIFKLYNLLFLLVEVEVYAFLWFEHNYLFRMDRREGGILNVYFKKTYMMPICPY